MGIALLISLCMLIGYFNWDEEQFKNKNKL